MGHNYALEFDRNFSKYINCPKAIAINIGKAKSNSRLGK